MCLSQIIGFHSRGQNNHSKSSRDNSRSSHNDRGNRNDRRGHDDRRGPDDRGPSISRSQSFSRSSRDYVSHSSQGASHRYSSEVDKENRYPCITPPLPTANVRLQQWDSSGISYTNNTHDGGWNATEESMAGALLNIAGN